MEASIYDPLIRIEGDIAYIPLSKGKHKHHKYALIDVSELERVLRHNWYAACGGKTYYATATSLVTGLPSHHRRLHMFVMRANVGDLYDHENGNGLDCRKTNLRPATQQQNSQNTFKGESPGLTSKFKGVRKATSGKWIAQITVGGSPKLIGLFDQEDQAARSYDVEAVKAFGEFAKTNEKMGLYEAESPNRVRNHSAFTRPAAPAEVLPPDEWERVVATPKGVVYVAPHDESINREIEIRSAVAHIACPRKRRKEASVLRRQASA